MLGLACWSHGGGGGVDVGQAGGVVNYHSDQASFATNFKVVGGEQLSVSKGRCPGSKHMFFYKVYRGRGGGSNPFIKILPQIWYVAKAFWQHGI